MDSHNNSMLRAVAPQHMVGPGMRLPRRDCLRRALAKDFVPRDTTPT